jgi:hypothetical protein
VISSMRLILTTSGENAEYDAADYNYQIVDHSDDVIALFGDKKMRDFILQLINENESRMPT